jgi:His/Glu/Gln/Arg/opine family amino acid ABC transporter permease subunit
MIEFFLQYWHLYLSGLGVALLISVFSYALALVIGTFGAIGRTSGSRPARIVAASYVAVFRSMPPLLTLYIVYFALPSLAMSIDVPAISSLIEPLGNRIFAAVVAFTLASGAYATEIIRSGIASVPEEQIEAAKSIGMPYNQAFRRIIAPQAFRIAFPTLSNEYLIALKATSLASVIGVVELMRTAQILASTTFQHLVAYSIAGIFYVVFVSLLQFLLQRVENRLPGTVRPF